VASSAWRPAHRKPNCTVRAACSSARSENAMNDFELLRDLRALRVPRQPRNDLWSGIATRIETPAARQAGPARRRWFPLAAAASVALAVSAGVFSIALQGEHAATGPAYSVDTPSVRTQIERAHELAARGDPRLAGAEG